MIDILIPTLGRAHLLGTVSANVAETTSLPHRLLFVLDEDDDESRAAVHRAGAEFTFHNGTYPEKINAGFAHTDGELVLPTADDVRFYPGWLEAVLAVLEAEPRVAVVGTDDLSPATADRTHATMPVLRRSYCKDPGAVWGETGSVFFEGYRHNFCETETCQLAQHRGLWAFAEDSKIEHLHPAWAKREIDDTDRRGNLVGWEEDERLFARRRARWSRS